MQLRNFDKIIDQIYHHIDAGEPFFSFEFFPPKTAVGLANLYERMDRLVALEPLWIDVTWGAGGSAASSSLDLTRNLMNYFSVQVMMHLTCTGMQPSDLKKVCAQLLEMGVSNILALRGDPPQGQASWKPAPDGFKYGSQMVQMIREEFGEQFGIAVGAYPEKHAESRSLQDCVAALKIKLDAGSDFAITQLFYDLDHYDLFLAECARQGISKPIIPGILPIQNYQRFKRFTDLAQIHVPSQLAADLEQIKDDDSAVQAYGIEHATQLCQALLSRKVPGLHFYTLNLESSVTAILEKLGLTANCRAKRALPWRPSAISQRASEDVRPIFWSNRPKSYLARTSRWDDFPNGRWGSSASPTFGALEDYYLAKRGMAQAHRMEVRRAQWGKPVSFDDLKQVFKLFCAGQISELPWCETAIQSETGVISEQLEQMINRGYLSINSQPAVNAALSDDPFFGWGGSGGYVYQKAYVEFFCLKDQLAPLLLRLETAKNLSYNAIDLEGQQWTNVPTGGINAVTWGVFPNKEIIQPTVVDPESFLIWKEEAFALWHKEWRELYDVASPSYKFLSDLPRHLVLVNVVDNDFVSGDIFRTLLA